MRLLMAGSLSVVAVPAVEIEAVRDLVRSRAHLRDDLARARQRVSKMLLRYGRVYPKRVCWTKQHRLWLADQRWDHTASELAYLDYLAAVDGLVARRAAIDERLSRIAQEPELWPAVARLRCFRGIDTLTALGLAVEVGEWQRFRRPAQLSAWLGLVPSLSQSGEPGSWRDHQDRQPARAPVVGRGGVALPASATHRRDARAAPGRSAGARFADRVASPDAAVSHLPPPARPRQATVCGHHRRRPRVSRIPMGGRAGALRLGR